MFGKIKKNITTKDTLLWVVVCAMCLASVLKFTYSLRHPKLQSERVEFFYEKEFYISPYTHQEELINQRLNNQPIFVKDPYSEKKQHRINRPFNIDLYIPNKDIIRISHPYLEIAKEVYDYIYIGYTLPDLNSKTPQTIQKLLDPENKDSLNIFIGDGALKTYDAEEHIKLLQEKKYQIYKDKKVSNKEVSIYHFSDKNPRFYYFGILEPKIVLSPSQQPIFMKCITHKFAPINNCEVNFFIPNERIKKTKKEMGFMQGLAISYTFNSKYAYFLPKIHAKVISSIYSYLEP